MPKFEVTQAPLNTQGEEITDIPLAVLDGDKIKSTTVDDFSPAFESVAQTQGRSETDQDQNREDGGKSRRIIIKHVGGIAVIVSVPEAYANFPEEYQKEHETPLGTVSARERNWSMKFRSSSSFYMMLHVRYMR